MERTKLWEAIYNKSNKKVTFLSTNEKLKEARVRNPGRNDQMNPSIIVQEASNFLEDEGFSKLKYGTEPRPKTFTIFDKQGEISVNVAINGDYTDDILINAFFDSRCGFGYVIQGQTLDGRIEWAGFDKSEFKEDLEDAWLTANKFFEANKDKHTLEMWLIREFGQDKAHDTLEKLYQQGQEEAFTKFLSRKEFDAYKSSLTEKTESAIKENKGLKEGRLDHIKAKWQSELDKGVEPKTLMDPWAVCEGMKWLGKDGWIRVEEVLVPTEYEEPYPDFYMEIFDQRTCRISHDIYTINEINSYVRETKARLVNNGTKNLAERVLDYDTYDKYYDEGAEAYFEGKTLSDVPITGNAWFREAWEEGWKNAKACAEEDYGADYEDEYWEDYDTIQESAKLKEDTNSERKEMQALFRKAARKAKVKILDTYTKNKRHWSVTLDTEDEYDADNFRDAMDDLLGENSGTHSYDDMEGLGSVHIGVFEYYEYSDDDYRDLDPSIRDKYVVYCEPAELYKRRRQIDW